MFDTSGKAAAGGGAKAFLNRLTVHFRHDARPVLVASIIIIGLLYLLYYALQTDFSTQRADSYMNLTWPKPTYDVWGIYWIIRFAIFNPMLTFGLLAVGVAFAIRRSSDMPTSVDLALTLVASLYVAAFLPIMISILVTYAGVQLFDDQCRDPQMAQVTWLVIDSMAKGALLDFMESFHIDLSACAPNRHSWTASSIIFLIRGFSTYFVVWAIMMLWAMRPSARTGRYGP